MQNRDVTFRAITRHVAAEVDRLAPEMVAFLQHLTRIPTVNPPGDLYAPCAEFIGQQLKAFGYDVEQIVADDSPLHTPAHPRVNVMGRFPGATQQPVLHFNGHFDVVPAGDGWTVDPFGGEIRDGKVYGRGTCDQKAGIAASIFAIEAIRRAGVTLHGTIEQSATVDEESGGFAGVATLARRGYIAQGRTTYVIITEPSNVDRICIGHRGVYWFKVTQHGRIGHGSMPQLGVSAIDHLGDVLHALTHELKPRLAERVTQMPVEPPGSRHASLNINAIFGGQPEHTVQTPCVADRAGLIGDRRFLPEEEPFDANVKPELVELLDTVNARIPGARYTLEDLMIVHPVQTDTGSPLIAAVRDSIHEVLGVTPPLMASPGTYDHKHVYRIGNVADCIAYGPGILDLAHQPDEYVEVEHLIQSAKVMAFAAMRLLGTR